jgi:hypothetical protein
MGCSSSKFTHTKTTVTIYGGASGDMDPEEDDDGDDDDDSDVGGDRIHLDEGKDEKALAKEEEEEAIMMLLDLIETSDKCNDHDQKFAKKHMPRMAHMSDDEKAEIEAMAMGEGGMSPDCMSTIKAAKKDKAATPDTGSKTTLNEEIIVDGHKRR